MRPLTSRGRLPLSDSFPAYSPWMQFVDGHWVAPLCHICLLESSLIVPTTEWGQAWNPKPLLDLGHCGQLGRWVAGRHLKDQAWA